MHKKQVATIGFVLGAVAVMLVTALIIMPYNTKTAYAEQVAKKSYAAVASLTPEEQKALKEKVSADAKTLLEKAKTAKDLKVLSFDQFASQYPIPPERPGRKGPDLKDLQFLQFTDTDGSTVVLGVEQHTNLPAFIMMSKKDSNGAMPKAHGEQGFGVGSSDAKQDVMFGSFDGKTNVEGTVDGNGEAVFIIDGKKYRLPEETPISPDQPPSVKVAGNAVYINGQKAVPVE